MKSIHNFFAGFSYPLKGISFIFVNPEIAKYIVSQFLINAIAFIITLSISFVFYTRWLSTLILDKTIWYTVILYYISLFFGTFLLILVNIFIASILGGILGGGLNTKLSEKTEELNKKQNLSADIGFLKGFSRDIGYEIKSLLFILCVYILLIPFSFIPVIGPFVFLLLSFIYSLFAICFKFWDYPMERRLFDFRKKISFVMKSGSYFLGFGFASSLLLMIPVVNFLIPSVCIISGTLLYVEKLEKEINL
jgi:uncharacterized protein involved in cysteine biosynthesis